MMGRRGWVIAIVCLLSAGPVFAELIDERTVLLLSWDGLRHDFPDRGTFPGLKRMEQDGVVSTSEGGRPREVIARRLDALDG